MFTRQPDLEQIWKFEKDTQRLILNPSDMLMWRTSPPIKLQHHTRQYLRSYCVHKASWPLGSLKVQKGHIKVTIKPVQFFYVENTTLKIQHDTRNLQRVIRFTRSFRMPPTWKFKKVTHRSTSNLAEILMRRTLLPVKLQYGAGKYSEALSYSQGAATCRHLNMT